MVKLLLCLRMLLKLQLLPKIASPSSVITLILKRKNSFAMIFVDNSGADIILGILPFARELLRRGTQVILAANELPSINDVTYTELFEILSKLKDESGQLMGVDTSKLLIANSGDDLPVIDLSSVSQELSYVASDADLVILEGMGNIARWLKKEGDQVNPGDVLCEVETDKATVEMECMEEGYLAKIVKGDGSQGIQVGEVIAITVEEEEDIQKFKDYTPSSGTAETKKPSEPEVAETRKSHAPAPAADRKLAVK